MLIDYGLLWFIILNFTMLLYVFKDGTSIGMGILLIRGDPIANKKIINILLPTWDANQTWLVLTFAGLYGGFPKVFAELMTANYLPILTLVFIYMLRGAAIEFLQKSRHTKTIWQMIISFCSLLLTVLHAYLLMIYLFALVNGQFSVNRDLEFYLLFFFAILSIVSLYTLLALHYLKQVTYIVAFFIFAISYLFLATTFHLFYLQGVMGNTMTLLSFNTLTLVMCFLIFWLENYYIVRFLVLVYIVLGVIHFHHVNYPELMLKGVALVNLQAEQTSLIFMISFAAVIIPILLISLSITQRLLMSEP